MARLILPRGERPRLLLNGPAELALQAGMDGVHLPGGWTAGEVRAAKERFVAAGRPEPVVSVTTHGLMEVRAAAGAGADLILFGPLREKRVGGEWVAAGTGFEALATAVEAAEEVPVLALGGIRRGDWEACRASGAAGLAGIRLFLEVYAGESGMEDGGGEDGLGEPAGEG